MHFTDGGVTETWPEGKTGKLILSLRGISKYFGGVQALQDVDLDIHESEVTALVGDNGAGKSTTIRTLMGLIRPTGGNAAIFGLDCQTQASEIARNVGYLPSENSYYENMKVHQLLQYTADLYGMDCWSKANDLAARLDLDLYRKISDLSLGNRKKAGIVSALITGPKLVIMDEPTKGVDVGAKAEIYQIMGDLALKGYAIILISSEMPEILGMSDRIIVMCNGRVTGELSRGEATQEGILELAMEKSK